MKAISIRQPWAWLIVNGYKDIENRSWDTNYRGLVLIHASSKPVSPEDYLAALTIARSLGIELPGRKDFDYGGIVGHATITGTVRESESPWFFGPVGFQLTGSKPLPFQPLKGRLSFFETGYGVVAAGRKEALIPELNLQELKL